jgi:hypothetical protein
MYFYHFLNNNLIRCHSDLVLTLLIFLGYANQNQMWPSTTYHLFQILMDANYELIFLFYILHLHFV